MLIFRFIDSQQQHAWTGSSVPVEHRNIINKIDRTFSGRLRYFQCCLSLTPSFVQRCMQRSQHRILMAFQYVELRLYYLHGAQANAYTAFVKGIPEMHRTEAGIRKYFRSLYPETECRCEYPEYHFYYDDPFLALSATLLYEISSDLFKIFSDFSFF